MASGYVAMFDALGQIDKVRGVSGLNFISNQHLHNPQSQVADVGYDANIDFERMVALRPDVVMMYGVAGENSLITSKLRELGIPYMYIGDYVEQSPLGKAEWIYVVAELTGTQERADSLFGAVKHRYQTLAETVAQKATSHPKVMLNTPYRDVWFLPSADNYMVRLITDAGGEAYASVAEGNSSQPIDAEKAYLLASQADVWLNVGGCTSLAELKAQNPRFAKMPIVQKRKVYNNNRRRTQSGGSDFWESGIVRPDLILGDLIQILHPEIAEAEELVYYEQLK
jgi:iron complex transport system substrate-binding protein